MEVSKVTTADRDRTKHVVYAVVYGVGKYTDHMKFRKKTLSIFEL